MQSVSHPVKRSGRCHECRRRKRKCDELRPKCSLCAKSNSSCSYTEFYNFIPSMSIAGLGIPKDETTDSSRDSSVERNNDVHTSRASNGSPRSNTDAQLQLRTTKAARTGTGSYRTFALASYNQKRAQAAIPIPCSPSLESGTDTLCRVFITIIADRSRSSFCFSNPSNWLSYLPSRLAHSDLLRAAASCAVLTYSARGNADEAAKTTALSSYVSVIHQLRHTLANRNEQVKNEVVAVMKLLEILDANLEPHALSWRSHAFASIDLILAAGPEFCNSDFGRALFHSSMGMGWLKGFVTGEPSPFDQKPWLAVQPSSCISPLVLAEEDRSWQRARILTLLPRLIKLIRLIKQDAGDWESFSAAETIADELLDLGWDAGAKPPPEDWYVPADAAKADVLFFQLHFPEPSYQNTIAHSMDWAVRINIACLCHSLLTLGLPQPPHWPSLTTFAEEEKRCALLICAAMPRFTPDMWSHTASVTMMPLQTAWCSLWRQSEVSKEDSQPALMTWLEDRIREYAAAMGVTTNRDELIGFARILQGDGLWTYG